MLSKSAYRAIRYHPVAERLQNTLRKTSGVRFEEIDLHRLLDEKLANRIGIAVLETHERFSPEVAAQTNDLKKRLEANGLGHWRLDWI